MQISRPHTRLALVSPPYVSGGLTTPTPPHFGGHKTETGITAVLLVLATNLHATGAVLPPDVKLPKTITGPAIETCKEFLDTFQKTIVPRLLEKVEAIQGKATSPSQINVSEKPTVSSVFCGAAKEGVKPITYPLISVPILKTTPANACQLIGNEITNTPLRSDIRNLLNRADSLNVGWNFSCTLKDPPPIKITDPTNVVFVNPFSRKLIV